MARDSKNKVPRGSEEQEEMTVVILRFKGGGETLQKGFDAVSQALAALGQSPAVHHHRRFGAPAQAAELPLVEMDGKPDTDTQDLEEKVENGTETGRESRERGFSSTRKYSTPTFISDLDLNGSDGVGWKDFAERKNPHSANEKYLLAAAWLAEHGSLENFTVDHIFTCFRAMGWEEQKDFGQPLRAMKSKKSYFENPSRGQWKLTRVGLEAAKAIAQKAE